MSYLQTNKAAWNRMVEGGSRFCEPASEEECRNALATLDCRGWLPPTIERLDVLCLAAGGGWQSILYAVAGANVTVVDLSPAMLAIDVREARRRNVSLQTVEASMDDLSMLRDESFDIVHQPVSTCYIESVDRVYGEVARVLRDGGLYISQHKQPTSLQISHRDSRNRYVVGMEYYRHGPLPATEDTSYREGGTVEYLHRWEQLVGGLCRCGFVLEDLCEPLRADVNAAPDHFGHRGRYVPPYVRLKARRTRRGDTCQSTRLWVPSSAGED
jgi:SAM-dependent methyltransferase